MFVFWHGIFLRSRRSTVNGGFVCLIPLVSVCMSKYKIMELSAAVSELKPVSAH